MKNSVTVVDPFIYKIFPEDYISLTQNLINNNKLFNEIDEANKNYDRDSAKKFSGILKRGRNIPDISHEELYKDFEIYRYFYKEVGASLKFNPLSQTMPGMHILNKILELLQMYNTLITPKAVYKFFDIIPDPDGFKIKGTDIYFTGKKLKYFASHSSTNKEESISSGIFYDKKILMYVVTIGPGIDDEVKSLSEKGDVFDAYLLNGIGAGAAEMVANDLNLFMNKDNFEKKYIYKRISPGYGDWHISGQEKIFRLLEPEKYIGVKLTSTFIMLPEKSTSGIMGLVNKS